MEALAKLSALLFGAGAAYHALGLVRPDWAEPSPPWRHALFVLVDAAAAAGLLRWRRAFLPAYAALALQQVLSHGWYGWRVYRAEGRVDWASVLVLVFMPLLLALLRRRSLTYRPGSPKVDATGPKADHAL